MSDKYIKSDDLLQGAGILAAAIIITLFVMLVGCILLAALNL